MTADVLRDYVYERWYLDLGLRKDGAAVPSQGDQKAAKRRVLGMGKDLLTQMKLPSAVHRRTMRMRAMHLLSDCYHSYRKQ